MFYFAITGYLRLHNLYISISIVSETGNSKVTALASGEGFLAASNMWTTWL